MSLSPSPSFEPIESDSTPSGDPTDDTPIEVSRRLYKMDAGGKLRVWFMERQGCKHRVVAGIDGGNLVTNAWTVCKSKGKGKAKTTPEEQAIKEVEALYEKGLKRDYYETPEEAAGPPRNYLPMLAESWKDTTWEKWVDRLRKAGCTPTGDATGVFFQPKLDGYCCIAKASGLQSREGLPIITAPHIEAALKPFFDAYPDAILHGELYNHELRDEFEKIGSLLKRQKDVTDEHIAEVVAKVQFHIYDYPGLEAHPFGYRQYRLYNDLADLGLWAHPLVCVPTTRVRDEEHLLELTAQAIEDGYEGGIGRLHLLYERAKRSWSVIKIKIFDSAEFALVKVHEGVGNYAGYAKSATCRMEDGREFDAGIKGKRDQWLADKLHADDKIVTVDFFGYTHGGTGVPRMGVVTKWHGDRRVL